MLWESEITPALISSLELGPPPPPVGNSLVEKFVIEVFVCILPGSSRTDYAMLLLANQR
jgi:hypothetical protein